MRFSSLYGVLQLCVETMSSSFHKSNCTPGCHSAKLARKCVFQVARSDLCLCARLLMRPRVCVHVCVAFARNTQRPRGLPRAQRTASACVLVPSKQGNLEHAEGASNKHNLIPLSSHTWLWIMQPGRLSVSV